MKVLRMNLIICLYLINIVITYFWVILKFISFSCTVEKKKLHGVVLNGTGLLLLPFDMQQGKKSF